MKVFRVAAMLALLAGPAYAQMPNINLMDAVPGKTDEEKAAESERDARYKETLKKIPDAKAANDPWGGMRSDPPKAPKATAPGKTSAAAKKKTTSTPN